MAGGTEYTGNCSQYGDLRVNYHIENGNDMAIELIKEGYDPVMLNKRYLLKFFTYIEYFYRGMISPKKLDWVGMWNINFYRVEPNSNSFALNLGASKDRGTLPLTSDDVKLFRDNEPCSPPYSR